MKRVFVTGATGFIGSYLVRQLVQRGVDVAVLMRAETDPWRLVDIRSQLHEVGWDGESLDSFSELFRSFAPDTVFHLGWSGVRNADRNHFTLATKNLSFATSLAQLSVDIGVQCWVGAGSQAEYGPKNCQIDETQLPQPTTLYGASKLSAGILTERIAALGGMRHAWLRIFSTYGPMDNPGWMLPTLIRTLKRGDRPSLTLGEQHWDFLFVEDAANAFVSVASAGAVGFFNVGSGQALTLRQIIESVRDLIDPRLELGFGEVPYRVDQVMCLHADVSRLQNMTSWRPRVSLTDGLQLLIASSIGCQ